ncbi:nucleoside phosphorylase domain-containing protein [Whalleya microplaca]|nr:nucleoside phosphorylase domain-containing protein [Whalleya microplaca]
MPYYEAMKTRKHPSGTFIDPGQESDKLYQVGDDGLEQLIERQQRSESERTQVWYGSIGSGEKHMKSSKIRDQLRDKYNIIGLEMEAAGTMNRIPVGVIRGVCDYADNHKNKDWQPYAAAMASAYAKAVLSQIPPRDGPSAPRTPQIGE